LDASADLAEAAEGLNSKTPAKVREPSALISIDGSSARRQSLDLGAIGNCAIAALIDRAARMVWCCYPRIDSDTVFDDLINRSEDIAQGIFAVELEHLAECTQAYQRNTAILRTVLTDKAGAKVEVIDFAPRFKANERIVRPPVLVRRIVPLFEEG